MKEFNTKQVLKKALQSSVANLDEAKGIVEIAIAAFNNVDSYGDIVRKGAFKKTFTQNFNRIKHVIDHRWDTTSIVGLPLKLWETDRYAMAQSQLNLDSDNGRDLFQLYKFFSDNNRTLEHSFAYRIIKAQDNEDIAGFDITELAMREYTTCGWGANEDTPLVSMKNDSIFADIMDLDNEQICGEFLKTIEQLMRKADISESLGKKLQDMSAILRKSSDEHEPLPKHSEPEPTQAKADDFKKLLFLTQL